MAARNRMPPWHEHIRLPNGREVLIRPVRPEDAEPMRAAFPLLQPEEIRQRFLHPMKELGAEQAERLTHPDPRREFALVAAEPLPPGEALVGAVARIAIDDNGHDAEFAADGLWSGSALDDDDMPAYTPAPQRLATRTKIKKRKPKPSAILSISLAIAVLVFLLNLYFKLSAL